MAVWIPRLVGQFTDSWQHSGLTLADAGRCGGIILAVGFVRVMTGWIGRLLMAHHGRFITYQLRKKLFEKWETLSPAYYHRHSIGDLLSHALSDVEVVRQLMSMGINVAVNGLSMLIAALAIMMLQMNWRLAVVGLGPLIAIPAIVRYFGSRIRVQSMRFQEALGRMSQMVEEVIGGIRAVKAFGNEAVVGDRFETKNDAVVAEKMEFVRLSSIFSSLIPLLSAIGFILVMSYGGYLTINKTISLGDFIAFLLYLTLLRLPLEQLGQVLNIVQRASASLKRLSELLNVIPAVSDHQWPLYDQPIRGNITVKNLTFRYPDTEQDVLSNISFTINQGSTVGIIGSIGSGKTTLTNLLLRLYEPPAGTIFIDGKDILHYPLARIREGIGYVPQNAFLFSTTILDNIGFSEAKPDKARAENAARTTAVYDNIQRFSEGFNTQIGERGVRLSGGQKQRVAIARMVYKDAPIQILDDSLSAVDTRTERAILKNLKNIGIPKTTIIISHRLSAVRQADEILVFDAGRIVERGTHAALIKQKGVYAQLWSMQSGVVFGLEVSPPTVTEEKTATIPVIEDDIEIEEKGAI
jgi:ATP-binding cassette subfamily B protein